MVRPKYDPVLDLSDRNNSHALMVELIGEGKRVLEVGCATGYMSRILASRGCRVVGIEADPEAARKAKEHCEDVLVADVEGLDFVEAFGVGGFDVIVFGDVLEHLRDPAAVLVRVRSLLSEGGSVVASVPNIAHGAVRLALLQGRFEYRPLGLLDEEHLRFFTAMSLGSLFDGAGYRIVETRRTVRPVFDTEIPLRPGDFPRTIRRRVERDPEAATYQFVLRAVPRRPRRRVSVVIPNWNGAKHLPECLDSLARQTFGDFETIVVDNGSTDGSSELLRERYPWVRIVSLGENRGFPAAANVGIRACESEYIVLLNNDTRAEEDWLARLVGAMDEVPEASSGASKMVQYERSDLIDSAGDMFSLRSWAGRNVGSGEVATGYTERAWIFGACAGAAIYRRSLFEDVGLFDEEFFLLYEDVHLAMRAQLAGHRCVYIPDAIVQHKHRGSTDTDASGVWARALRNRIWVAGTTLPGPLLVLWGVLSLPRLLLRELATGLRGRIRLRNAGRLEGGQGAAPDSLPLRRSPYVRELLRAFRRLPDKRKEVQSVRRVGSLRLLRELRRAHRPLGTASGGGGA